MPTLKYKWIPRADADADRASRAQELVGGATWSASAAPALRPDSVISNTSASAAVASAAAAPAARPLAHGVHVPPRSVMPPTITATGPYYQQQQYQQPPQQEPPLRRYVTPRKQHVAGGRKKKCTIPPTGIFKMSTGQFTAVTSWGGKQRYIGTFNTAKQATAAYITVRNIFKTSTGQFTAVTSWGGKQRYIGTFDTAKQATAAYTTVRNILVDEKSLAGGADDDLSDVFFEEARKKALDASAGQDLLDEAGGSYVPEERDLKSAPGKLKAQMTWSGKQRYIGEFDTPEQASAAYVPAKKVVDDANLSAFSADEVDVAFVGDKKKANSPGQVSAALMLTNMTTHAKRVTRSPDNEAKKKARSSSAFSFSSRSAAAVSSSPPSKVDTSAAGAIPSNSMNHFLPGGIGIEKPHPHDILSGRGGISNNHMGNKIFRTVCEHNKELYATFPRNEKLHVAVRLVEAVRSRDPPGRFLERKKGDKLWYEVTERRVVDKTAQALREKVHKAIRLPRDEIPAEFVHLLEEEAEASEVEVIFNAAQKKALESVRGYIPRKRQRTE